MKIRRLNIDVLMPHEPSVLVYAEKLSSLKGVEGITIHVSEIDEKTETLKMIIEGQALSFEKIKEIIENLGGSIHSIDSVSAGSRVIDFRRRDG